MQIGDLRDLVNKIPEEFNDFEMVNGEIGVLDPDDVDSAVYRLDKPIISCIVDEKNREMCFLHQTQEDMSKITDKV